MRNTVEFNGTSASNHMGNHMGNQECDRDDPHPLPRSRPNLHHRPVWMLGQSPRRLAVIWALQDSSNQGSRGIFIRSRVTMQLLSRVED